MYTLVKRAVCDNKVYRYIPINDCSRQLYSRVAIRIDGSKELIKDKTYSFAIWLNSCLENFNAGKKIESYASFLKNEFNKEVDLLRVYIRSETGQIIDWGGRTYKKKEVYLLRDEEKFYYLLVHAEDVGKIEKIIRNMN